MGLECLVLTADPALLTEMRTTLVARGISLQFRQDSASAIELVSRRHLDGLVVDCDDVPGAGAALSQLGNSAANKQTLILAVVNGSTKEREAIELGADFALNKPVQQTRLQNILELAIPKMEREHRRYFRHQVQLPVRFTDPMGQSFAASIQNISEGGLAIKLIDPVKLKGVVSVEFDLPSVEPQTLHGKAEIVWNDSFVMGLRFLYIEKSAEATFRAWLNSLEARLRFHESGARTP